MSFLFPKAPAAPPPPPDPTNPGATSIMEQGAAERTALANADGGGSDGTDITGGQGAKAPGNTTASPAGAPKVLLGG